MPSSGYFDLSSLKSKTNTPISVSVSLREALSSKSSSTAFVFSSIPIAFSRKPRRLYSTSLFSSSSARF